eukprot:3841531-Rhodomonas_salina.1
MGGRGERRSRRRGVWCGARRVRCRCCRRRRGSRRAAPPSPAPSPPSPTPSAPAPFPNSLPPALTRGRRAQVWGDAGEAARGLCAAVRVAPADPEGATALATANFLWHQRPRSPAASLVK